MMKICHIKKIYKYIYNLEKNFKINYDITLNEAIVLCSIEDNKNNTSVICKDLGLTAGRISKIISGLENKNYIQRNIDAEDKRYINFAVTVSGREKLHVIKKREKDFSINNLIDELKSIKE